MREIGVTLLTAEHIIILEFGEEREGTCVLMQVWFHWALLAEYKIYIMCFPLCIVNFDISLLILFLRINLI